MVMITERSWRRSDYSWNVNWWHVVARAWTKVWGWKNSPFLALCDHLISHNLDHGGVMMAASVIRVCHQPLYVFSSLYKCGDARPPPFFNVIVPRFPHLLPPSTVSWGMTLEEVSFCFTFPNQTISTFPNQTISTFSNQAISTFPNQAISAFPNQAISTFYNRKKVVLDSLHINIHYDIID